MSEITHGDDVLNKHQELDNYVSLSLDILKSLQTTKAEAEKILGSIVQKKDELSRREQDLADYLKSLQLVSQKAEAIFSPILQSKEELERLEKKVREGLESIGGEIQKQITAVVEQVRAEQKDSEGRLNESISTLRKEFEEGLTQGLNHQRGELNAVSQQVDGLRNSLNEIRSMVEQHQAALDGQSQEIEQQRREDADLREALNELKSTLEKEQQELATSLKKAEDEQKVQFENALTELREKHIKVLEKDDAQIKSALNGIIKKLSNVKFKKMLGLD